MDQNEKAFQKQAGIRLVKDKTTRSGFRRGRYYKHIGMGFKTPMAAITGTYVDMKCPFTGNVNVRGRIMKGVCVSNKMNRTLVIRRDYLHYIKKYRRFEKRHHNMPAHVSPAFPNVHEGDIITIGETRPLSKTVSFVVIAHEPVADAAASKKTFRIF